MPMNSKPVVITMSGRIGFEDSITSRQATQIIAFIDGGFDALGPWAPSGPATMPQQIQAPFEGTVLRVLDKEPLPSAQSTFETPRAAIEITGASNNAEKIVAFAGYVVQRGGETFTQEVIAPLFKAAAEKMPGNLTRDMQSAVRLGWITSSGGVNEYYLTTKGLDRISNGFTEAKPKRASPGTARPKTAAKPRADKAATPPAFASLEMVPQEIQGVIAFHKVKLKRDKMLWALRLAKDVGVPSLSNREIEWLTDKLGDPTRSKHVTAIYALLNKAGYANQVIADKSIRITPAGEEYLTTLSAEKG
jgi:hypothetical protein